MSGNSNSAIAQHFWKISLLLSSQMKTHKHDFFSADHRAPQTCAHTLTGFESPGSEPVSMTSLF